MAYVTPTFRSTSRFDQIGTVTGSLGASGSVVVTLPVGYTTASSYVTMASHTDSTAGLRLSIVNTSAKTFTIYWTGGGASTQPFSWFTTGS
jgi:hypothetical protein